jgi:hypothetical protein
MPAHAIALTAIAVAVAVAAALIGIVLPTSLRPRPPRRRAARSAGGQRRPQRHRVRGPDRSGPHPSDTTDTAVHAGHVSGTVQLIRLEERDGVLLVDALVVIDIMASGARSAGEPVTLLLHQPDPPLRVLARRYLRDWIADTATLDLEVRNGGAHIRFAVHDGSSTLHLDGMLAQ